MVFLQRARLFIIHTSLPLVCLGVTSEKGLWPHIGGQIAFCKYFHFIPFNVLPISIACVMCLLHISEVITKVFIHYLSDMASVLPYLLPFDTSYWLYILRVPVQVQVLCPRGNKMKLQSLRWIFTTTIMVPFICHPLVHLYNTESWHNLD
jgi:hypothetical protein